MILGDIYTNFAGVFRICHSLEDILCIGSTFDVVGGGGGGGKIISSIVHTRSSR